MRKPLSKFVFIAIIVLFVSGCQTRSDQQIADRDIHVPSTVSLEAQQHLRVLQKAKPYTRAFPSADDDLEVWRKAQDAIEEGFVEASEKAIADNKVTVTEAKLGEVPVLDIRPEN